jgi:hypothetical protein
LDAGAELKEKEETWLAQFNAMFESGSHGDG